jgi:hypothetical protein
MAKISIIIPIDNAKEHIEKCLNSIITHSLRDIKIIIKNSYSKRDIFNMLRNVGNNYKENKTFEQYRFELEYLFIKIILDNSHTQILKIKNRNQRNSLLEENIEFLYSHFPNWKLNMYLHKNKGNWKYKHINKFTYKIYTLFHI